LRFASRRIPKAASENPFHFIRSGALEKFQQQRSLKKTPPAQISTRRAGAKTGSRSSRG
jgi:hypothetical protein